jgi:hypothetical protein
MKKKFKSRKPSGFVDNPKTIEDIVQSFCAMGFIPVVTPRVKQKRNKKGRLSYEHIKLKDL